MTEKNTDLVDIVSFIGSIVITTAAFGATGTLFWALPVFGTHYGLSWFRKSEWARKWRDTLLLPPMLENVAPLLLPGPIDDAITIRQDKPIDVRVVDAYETAPFWKRVTQPVNTEVMSAVRKPTQLVNSQIAFLNRALKRLPSYIPYTKLPNPPSHLCVPIGIDAIDGNVLWGDFSTNGNLIHALVAGQTGSGKDALLRLWFTTLTANNTPDTLQFVILDGKGVDWLSPALAESAFLAIEPAGGVDIQKRDGKRVNVAIESMAQEVDWIFEELKRRAAVMKQSGAVDIASYYKRTKIQLPYIFVLASDVGKSFNQDLEMLMQLLSARGRSYGVRLIISMQNPVGEDTGWRSQIGLVMSGYQQNPDHDRYIMGINVDRQLVRPSQLPNPEESDISKGLFVTRLGSTQHLIRTAHLPEDDWYRYIENVLPKKQDWQDVSYSNKNSDLLTHLLTDTAPKQPVTKRVLTDQQIVRIVELTRAGNNKTEIMHALGFSNGDVYKTKSMAVSVIINATKRKYELH